MELVCTKGNAAVNCIDKVLEHDDVAVWSIDFRAKYLEPFCSTGSTEVCFVTKNIDPDCPQFIEFEITGQDEYPYWFLTFDCARYTGTVIAYKWSPVNDPSDGVME
jgi:hypothetical protein